MRRETLDLKPLDTSKLNACFARVSEADDILVVLSFDIDPAGVPRNIVSKADGPTCFKRLAEEQLASWRWDPKMERGQAVWDYDRQQVFVFRAE